MPTINVTVRNKIAVAECRSVVCDNNDYTVVFNFDSEWAAHMTKTARFIIFDSFSSKPNQYYDVVFVGDQCNAPMIRAGQNMAIGVYAGNLCTTTPAMVSVVMSVLGYQGLPYNPPQSVYQQIMELLEQAIHGYVSIERLRSYLYRVTFDKLPEENGADVGFVPSGCSSYVQDGKLYRNLDWNYSNTLTFTIRCRGFEGNAFNDKITEGNLDPNLISQLPYRLVDGKNDYGIMVSAHVLYNDWNWHKREGSIPLTKLPFTILTNIKSMDNFDTDIADILSELHTTDSIDASGYLLQFLVTDGYTTYVIIPPESEDDDYITINATSNPKLANFRWVNKPTVTRDELQLRPTGVERWNMMPCDLSDLRFTECYEIPNRLSEFIGERGTTKDSTDEELMELYEIAHDLYLTRERDSSTWQTMHSAIYGENGLEQLYVQENFSDNYGKRGQQGARGPQGPAGQQGPQGPKGEPGAIKFIPVAALPTEDIDTSAIYLVSRTDPEEHNIFDEWVYINGAWEKMGGSVSIDLDDYYTKTQTDARISQLAPVKGAKLGDATATIDADGNIVIPVASGLQLGLGKPNATGGVEMNVNGGYQIRKATDEMLEEFTNNYQPVVPSNFKYGLLQAVSGTNHITLTTEQQATARAVFGAGTQAQTIIWEDD